MTSKFSIDNRELLQRISSGEAVVGIDFGNLIVRELAAFRLAAMDSEPDCKERKLFCSTDTARMRKVISVSAGTGDAPLYRHAQPVPVVPGEITAEQAYEIGDYHGDPVDVFARGANWMRQHIIDSLLSVKNQEESATKWWHGLHNEIKGRGRRHEGDFTPDISMSTEEIIDAINRRRAAMLAAAQQSPGSEPSTVPGKWIPVSERLPLTPSADCEYSDIEVNVFDGERVFTAHYANGSQPQPWGYWVDTYAKITHWQPLPAAPQEDKQ